MTVLETEQKCGHNTHEMGGCRVCVALTSRRQISVGACRRGVESKLCSQSRAEAIGPFSARAQSPLALHSGVGGFPEVVLIVWIDS